MKKYIAPEIEVEVFDSVDVIMDSAVIDVNKDNIFDFDNF